MNTVLRRTLLSTLVVPFAFGVQSASAAMINTWDYNADSSFTDWEPSADADAIDEIDTDGDGDFNKLAWGDPSPTYPNQSSISIGDTTGSVNTNEWENGASFIHDNQIIDVTDPSLTSFVLNSTLFLTPTDPAGPMESTSLSFNSFFSETPNQPASSCLPESTAGVPCDDIFTIGNVDGLGGEAVTVGDQDGYEFTNSFTVDDYTYTVFLQLLGVDMLSSEACAEAAAGAGCVGFLTQEGQQNFMDTRFKITAAQQVPEPGTLALLGLGLAGLGLSRRKKAVSA